MIQSLWRRAGGPDERRPIWRDRWCIALAVLAVGLDAALAYALWRRYEQLPALIAIHFNAYGEVDLIADKREVYKLPGIGAVILLANAVLAAAAGPQDRVLARLALGVAVLVEALFCVAALRIAR